MRSRPICQGAPVSADAPKRQPEMIVALRIERETIASGNTGRCARIGLDMNAWRRDLCAHWHAREHQCGEDGSKLLQDRRI